MYFIIDMTFTVKYIKVRIAKPVCSLIKVLIISIKKIICIYFYIISVSEYKDSIFCRLMLHIYFWRFIILYTDMIAICFPNEAQLIFLILKY